MISTIISDINALALHHRAFDRLQDRSDIRGDISVPASVRAYLPRLLVAGLDFDADPGNGGLPLPTGGRYRKLCFSPLIQDLAQTKLNNLGVHDLPHTEQEFQDYVSLTTGFSSKSARALFRLYRLEPGMLHHACRQMQTDCPPAWRLLLSNEFSLAAQAWPALRRPVGGSPFKHPLIHGFMFLAEQERASLIMRHLARADAIMNRSKLLAALESSQPLRNSFAADELFEVYRWLEYGCFSSEALGGLLFDRKVEEILALPSGYPLWALSRGHWPAAICTIIDDPAVRASLVRVFTPPPLEASATERRKQMLRDDHIVRWYGMTNEVLPILALEGARERFPTRKISLSAVPQELRSPIGESSSDAVIKLASAMRTSWDLKTQKAIVDAATQYVQSSRSRKSVTLEVNLKLGRKRALTYLPPTGRPGSAARFDPLIWDDLNADNELWSMFIAPTSQSIYRLNHPEHSKVKATLTVLRRVFVPLMANMEESPLTLKIANDMAAALSPISANPQIAFAIAALDLAPNVRERLGYRSRRSGYGRK